MKRPFDPIPVATAGAGAVDGESNEMDASKSKREFPKRKVAMILGYSGTGYQGMQR